MALTEFKLTRTTFTDDDGSGTTGTILDNAAFQAIYQQIDNFNFANGRGLLTGRIYPVSGYPSWEGLASTYTTIYFGPADTPVGAAFAPGIISLYDGANWKLYTFTEISLSLSGLTNGTSYDLFVYNSGGTLTLEAVAWVSSSVHSATTTQDGIEVKSGAASKRFVGSININGGTGTLAVNRSTNPIWNRYNQLPLALRAVESTANWTTTDATPHPGNSNTANRITTLCGRANPNAAGVGDVITVRLNCMIQVEAIKQSTVGIGLNSTSTYAGGLMTGNWLSGVAGAFQQIESLLQVAPPPGMNYYQWLEQLVVGVNVGFGSGGSTSGIYAEVKC